MMRKGRSIFYVLAGPAVVCALAVWYCNMEVEAAAKGKTYADVNRIPHRHTGLLLGTGKYYDGIMNPYYTYRIAAAAALMKAGKIDVLIISGDNGTRGYNEPALMRADLIAAGADSSHIFLDFAGFRTFDSMVRLKKIFSQDAATVISQRFHNERALYIAQREGIDAIGYNAEDVYGADGLRMQVREKLARVKVFIDYLLGTEPRFLGQKVDIP